MTDLTSGATNYNDGKWHGWNGGECPVHPETVVEVVTRAGIIPLGGNTNKAKDFGWSQGNYFPDPNIIAFRVIEKYREPHEVYRAGGIFFYTRAAAEAYTDAPITVFREVVE